MKYLKNAFDLYLNSSLHVSLAVVSLTLITYIEQDMEINADLLAFIFFASVTGYNFVKYAGIAKLHHLSLAANLRFIQLFSLGCFVCMLYFTFKLNLATLIATAILGLFTLFYATPVLGVGKNLRSLPGIKIFIIAMVWAGSTVLLPLINAYEVLGSDRLVDFIQRLLLVLVLTLPFEIRDVDYDNEKLGTIPQKMGIGNTKIFGSILLLLVLASELFQKTFSAAAFLALFVITLVMLFMLWNSRRAQGKYFASFWVESLPILYLSVYLLLNDVLPHILF